MSEPERDQAAELVAALRREMARLRRRVVAIERDVDRASEGQQLQARAQLAAAGPAPKRGSRVWQVVDYGQHPPVTLDIELDPALEPRVQLQGWFKTARRYLRGAELGRERIAQTLAVIDLLDGLARDAEQPGWDPAADRRVQDPRVLRLLARPTVEASKRKQASPRRVFREFLGHGGARVWVGRGAADNDALTMRLARPQDMFVHVQGAGGAHVIVPLNKGQAIPPELLVDAALLAKHFSSAAGEDASDITYTPRRYVQKRRGAPPGLVTLLRHKVFRLRPDRERLKGLLDAELKT